MSTGSKVSIDEEYSYLNRYRSNTEVKTQLINKTERREIEKKTTRKHKCEEWHACVGSGFGLNSNDLSKHRTAKWHLPQTINADPQEEHLHFKLNARFNVSESSGIDI